jgi:hypothetical protein
MVAGIYAENETGEKMKIGFEQSHNVRSFIKPSWLQNSRPEPVERLKLHMLLASNPNTPEATLDLLADGESLVLLERIAENPNTSAYTLSKLAFHDNPRIRAAVAENPSLPESIMWRLASDVHPDVRLRLAESYLLPSTILLALAEDDNPYVQSRARRTLDRLNQPMTVSLALGCC